MTITEMIQGYLIVAGCFFAGGIILTAIMVSEHKGSAKHPHSAYHVQSAKESAVWVRRWLYMTLLSPVWPVLGVLLLIGLVQQAFKISMEVDR